MIKSSYLSYLLSLIKTKQHADEIIEKIDELKDSLYNKRIDLDKKMGELFSFELKEKIKSYSWAEQVNLNDPESFGKFLSNLRGHIKNMPIVTIKIAFEPNAEIVTEVSSWFVENFGKNVLVDLILDESLVAGAVIVFDESEKDFSLKKRIEEKYKPVDWKKITDQLRYKNASTNNSLLATNGEQIKQVAPTL